MMACSVLFLASALTRRADLPTEPHIATAREAAARLGAATGRPVTVAGDLARIPVLVAPGGTPPGETLRTLAFALHASLVRDGNALRVERTADDRRAARAAHLSANRAYVGGALGRWDRILKRADGFGDPAAQVRRAREETAATAEAAHTAGQAHQPFTVPPDLMSEYMVRPDARLLHGLLARIGVDRLADFAPGEIPYLSNHPNAAEGPLPPCEDLLDAFARSQADYARAMDLPEPGGAPAKVIVDFDNVGASITVFDGRGRQIGGVGENYLMRALIAGSPDPATLPAPRWVDLDAPSREVEETLRGDPGRRTPEALPKSYLWPERSDPLDFAVRQGVLAVPRLADKAPLVAALDDTPLGWAWRTVHGARLDDATFADRLLGTGGFERVAQGGATVIRPVDPLESESQVADRAALGREIRRVVAARDLGMRSWCHLQAAVYPQTALTERALSPLPRLGLPSFAGVQNQAWPELWALIGFAQEDAPPADGARIERLLREGINHHWLRFDGPPGTTDLDRAPSTALAALDRFRLLPTLGETAVARLYGTAGDEYLRSGFSMAREADTLGFEAVAPWTPQLRSKEMSRREAEDLANRTIHGSHYQLGRRIALGADVRLANGLRAHVEERDWVADRADTAFDELPAEFQQGILRGEQRTLDNPPDLSVSPFKSFP